MSYAIGHSHESIVISSDKHSKLIFVCHWLVYAELFSYLALAGDLILGRPGLKRHQHLQISDRRKMRFSLQEAPPKSSSKYLYIMSLHCMNKTKEMEFKSKKPAIDAATPR